jgi:hypothetical protein
MRLEDIREGLYSPVLSCQSKGFYKYFMFTQTVQKPHFPTQCFCVSISSKVTESLMINFFLAYQLIQPLHRNID